MAANKGKLLGYAEIAEVLGVKVRSVRDFKWRDSDFPEPATPEGSRSPAFWESDVLRYKKLREVRNVGKKGRPPRSAVIEVTEVKMTSRATPAEPKTTNTRAASARKRAEKPQAAAEAPKRAPRTKKPAAK